MNFGRNDMLPSQFSTTRYCFFLRLISIPEIGPEIIFFTAYQGFHSPGTLNFYEHNQDILQNPQYQTHQDPQYQSFLNSQHDSDSEEEVQSFQAANYNHNNQRLPNDRRNPSYRRS